MSQKQLQEHLKRWENWNKGIHLQNLQKNSKEELGKFANNIVQKLNKPLDSLIQKSIKEEVENLNSCGVCFQLMIHPKQPYSLYPCGHSFCKVCMFNGRDPKNKDNIRIKTCPYCRETITGCALNLSLMKIIKKAESHQQPLEPQSKDLDQQSTQIRYRILQKQMKQMNEKLLSESNKLKVKETVEKKLLDDRAKIRKQIQKLQEEDELIQSHLRSNIHDIKLLRQTIENMTEKYILLQKTFDSVGLQRDKLKLLKR